MGTPTNQWLSEVTGRLTRCTSTYDHIYKPWSKASRPAMRTIKVHCLMILNNICHIWSSAWQLTAQPGELALHMSVFRYWLTRFPANQQLLDLPRPLSRLLHTLPQTIIVAALCFSSQVLSVHLLCQWIILYIPNLVTNMQLSWARIEMVVSHTCGDSLSPTAGHLPLVQLTPRAVLSIVNAQLLDIIETPHNLNYAGQLATIVFWYNTPSAADDFWNTEWSAAASPTTNLFSRLPQHIWVIYSQNQNACSYRHKILWLSSIFAQI